VRDEETVERVAEVFEKNLNIKRDFDMELLEHIKDEKERVTENPDAKKVLDNLENMRPSGRFRERSEGLGRRKQLETTASPRSSTRRWLPARRVSTSNDPPQP